MNTSNLKPQTSNLLALASYLFLFSAFCITPVFAQKKKDKLSNQTEKSVNERELSRIFADGLREFYSQNYSAATNSFREVLNQNPKNDAAYYLLHKIAAEQQDFVLAAHYLKEAVKLDKKNEWYQIDLAGVYEQLGDFSNAVKIWEEICKMKYQNEYYLMSLANNYLQLEKYAEVIKTYDKIENILGKNDELTEVKKNLYLYLNDVKNAVREYEKLLELYPYEIGYYIVAGEIYLSNNMSDKALPFFEKAIEIDAENGYLNLALANYYEKIKKPEVSFEKLNQAFLCPELEMEEKVPILRNWLILSLQSKSPDIIEKTQQLAQSIAYVHPLDLEGWATIAKLYALQEDYENAKFYYEKCIFIDQSQSSIWEEYIFVLSKQNGYGIILENADILEEYFPTNSKIQCGLAIVLLNEKQYERAIKAAKQALAFTFENNFVAELNLLLGDIFFELDQKEEAVKYWKTAQKKGINTLELQEKIEANQ